MQEPSPKKCNISVYSYASLDGIQPSDGLPVRYAWIDQNIASNSNRSDLQMFRQVCQVEPFADQVSFLKFLMKLNRRQQRLRVICSASLADQFYMLLQQQEKIESAMLYCCSLTKAGILMSDYPKIKAACFTPMEVVEMISRWERQQLECLNFWEDKDITNLHRNTVNWRCLIYENSQNTKSLIKIFLDYCRRVVKQRMLHEINTLEGVEITSLEVLFQYALQSKLLFAEVNRLFRSTKSPEKLAYIRWPTSWFFSFIKESYDKAKYNMQASYFAVLCLNREEKRRLQPGKLINIRQFIQAREKIPLLEEFSEETIFQIQVEPWQRICNGYIRYNSGAVFNLANFYRVQTVNHKQKTVKISLLAFNQNYPLKQEDPLSSLVLYQVRLAGQKVFNYGQWYSLLLSGNQTEADNYSDREVKLLNKDNIKWGLIRQNMAVKMYGRHQNSLDFLLTCRLALSYNQNSKNYDYRIILTMAEIILFEKQEQFTEIYNALTQSLQKSNVKTQKQIKIFEIAHKLLFRPGGLTRQNFCELKIFEELLIENKPYDMCTDLYQLCLFLKSKYFRMVGQPQDEIKTLNKLLWILGSTLGQESHRFKKVTQLKQEAYERLYKEEYQEDMRLKQSLMTSQISVQELLYHDQLLKIDLTSTNIAIFRQT